MQPTRASLKNFYGLIGYNTIPGDTVANDDSDNDLPRAYWDDEADRQQRQQGRPYDIDFREQVNDEVELPPSDPPVPAPKRVAKKRRFLSDSDEPRAHPPPPPAVPPRAAIGRQLESNSQSPVVAKAKAAAPSNALKSAMAEYDYHSEQAVRDRHPAQYKLHETIAQRKRELAVNLAKQENFSLPPEYYPTPPLGEGSQQ